MDCYEIHQLKEDLKESGIELINKSFKHKNNANKIFWQSKTKEDYKELEIEEKYYLLFLSLGLEYLLKYLYLKKEKSIFKIKDKIYSLNGHIEFKESTLDFNFLIENIDKIIKDDKIKEYKKTMQYLREIRNGVVHLFKNDNGSLSVENQNKIKDLLKFLKRQVNDSSK